MTVAQGIREAAVAGWFYPGEPDKLTATVDRLLAAESTNAVSAPPRMLLAPHAGYAYSGAIAARGFSRLRSPSAPPSRAFIIGPSHVEPFDFTSVFDGTAYRTPLGDVLVDEAAAKALSSSHPSIRRSPAGHALPAHGRGEHGIEVELPFLQRISADIRVIPIVMGDQDWDACVALGNALASVIDWHHDIVVASSDLSHFYTYEKARKLDGVFCSTVSTMDAAALHQRIARRECEACGAAPMMAALLATEALRNRACEVLACVNSGDVTGERASVVGYASAIVTGEPA